MSDHPKTLTFFPYGDATQNAINQISHNQQISTDQPRIQNLPLPPMLPQNQNENLQPPKITSITAPFPRVKPVLLPPRVQTQKSAPTRPPRQQPSKSPRFVSIYKKIGQIFKTRKTKKGNPESSTPITLFPEQLQDKFSQPRSTAPCCQPFI